MSTATLPFPPKRLLLATDLSPRCDRALDRFVQLAQTWQAHVTALNVFGAPAEPDQIIAWAAKDPSFDLQEDARRQLCLDLGELGASVDVRLVQSADAAGTIAEVARTVDAELVVTGVARDEPLGRFLLGSNVERLARKLDQSLLIVRNRPRTPYSRVVVATDLSDGSGEALRVATGWFPGAERDLFHAVRLPGGGGAPIGADPQPASQAVQDKCEQFIQESGVPRTAVREVVAVEGTLGPSLTRYVRARSADLVVIGAHESEGFLDKLSGSSFTKVLHWIPCDVLVVAGTR